jgi:hypothetical protein
LGATTATLGVGLTFTVDAPPPERISGIVTGVPFADVTFPVTVIVVKLCPGAKELPFVQVVVAKLHAHNGPLIPVTMKPVGGSATVTVPLVAAVPVLDTVIV